MLVIAEHDRADRILLEVQRHTERVLRELEHLAIAGVGQAVDADDAVGHTDYRADVAGFQGCLEVFDAFLDQLADFRRFECHLVFLST